MQHPRAPCSHLHPTHRAGTPLARSTRYSSSACVGLTRRSRAPTHSNTGVCTCSTACSGCLAPRTQHPVPILTLPHLRCLGDGRAQQHGGHVLGTWHPLEGVGQPQGDVAPAVQRHRWVSQGRGTAQVGAGTHQSGMSEVPSSAGRLETGLRRAQAR